MELGVLSRHEAINFDYQGRFAIISILDPEQEYERCALYHHLARFNNKHTQCMGLLSLDFVDIEVEINKATLLFTQAQAGAVSMFYHSMRDMQVENLYIHCEVGVSRSPAIAAALYRYTGDIEMHDSIWISPRTYPNALVYKKLCKELNIDVSEAEIQDLRRRSEEEYTRYLMEIENS